MVFRSDYESVLFRFRDITAGRTTNDGSGPMSVSTAYLALTTGQQL